MSESFMSLKNRTETFSLLGLFSRHPDGRPLCLSAAAPVDTASIKMSSGRWKVNYSKGASRRNDRRRRKGELKKDQERRKWINRCKKKDEKRGGGEAECDLWQRSGAGMEG